MKEAKTKPPAPTAPKITPEEQRGRDKQYWTFLSLCADYATKKEAHKKASDIQIVKKKISETIATITETDEEKRTKAISEETRVNLEKFPGLVTEDLNVEVTDEQVRAAKDEMVEANKNLERFKNYNILIEMLNKLGQSLLMNRDITAESLYSVIRFIQTMFGEEKDIAEKILAAQKERSPLLMDETTLKKSTAMIKGDKDVRSTFFSFLMKVANVLKTATPSKI